TGLVLDERSAALTAPDGSTLRAPHRIQCIANNQDFHALSFEPNGNLLFEAPTPLQVDGDRLAGGRWRADVLATTSDQTWLQPADGALPLMLLQRELGQSVPKLPLIVWLRHDDPWHGSLVGLAASTPF